MNDQAKCGLCGEPMPVGEEMFNFHGYSGPCPKPPLPDTPFASEPTELAYQKARSLNVSMSRDQFREILQVFMTADDRSRREYEQWKSNRERPVAK